MAGSEHDVDALRAKLKSLGYLDAGVDRFVLAPARAGRTPWQIASRSSVRLGVLAGLMLGLSGAIAVGVRIPGLLTGVRDTVVLAVLLALVFGAAVGALALVVILLATAAARRPGAGAAISRHLRTIALVAGASVGAGCLAYLTFLWRAMDAASSERSWWATTPALAVAAVVSVLLGHATTTTAQAVMANQLPAGDAMPRRRLSLRASAAIALAGLAAAAATLVFAPAPQAEGMAPPTLTVVATGTRLMVFAIDGYDETLGRRFGADRFLGRTLVTYTHMARQSDDPAREWTTIATGQPVERHRVTALEVRRVAGLEGQLPVTPWPAWANAAATAADLVRLTRPAINSGTIRREKTFWEVAAQAGLRTVAANWWTSWPARDEDGTVLTERAVLRLQSGGALAGEIAPASTYARLLSNWPRLSARAMALAELVLTAGPRANAARAEQSEPTGPPALPGPLVEALREAALVDAQQLVLLREVLDDSVDLATVYLPGLDILGTKLRAIAGVQASPTLLVESGEAVRRYYSWLFDQIARTAGRADAAATSPAVIPQGAALLLVGHPGRSGSNAPAVVSSWVTDTSLELDGQLPKPAQGTLYDVAPTILQTLGVPLSREFAGQPIWSTSYARVALPDVGGAAREAPAPAKVPTYGRRAVDRARAQGPAVLDEEMRDRLRSLGYVR